DGGVSMPVWDERVGGERLGGAYQGAARAPGEPAKLQRDDEADDREDHGQVREPEQRDRCARDVEADPDRGGGGRHGRGGDGGADGGDGAATQERSGRGDGGGGGGGGNGDGGHGGLRRSRTGPVPVSCPLRPPVRAELIGGAGNPPPPITPTRCWRACRSRPR